MKATAAHPDCADAKSGVPASRRAFLARAVGTLISGAVAPALLAAAPRIPVSLPRAAAGRSGALWLGGDLQVNRIGLGTAEFTGPKRWGWPADPRAIRALLRRAMELGVNFIDTAGVYGPGVAEQLIYDALSPYPRDLVIATKCGQHHDAPDVPNQMDASPQQLRASCEASLRRLHLERLPLCYLHSPDPKVPYEESLGALVKLQQEGKIHHIGIANVDLALLQRARAVARVASVQNLFNAFHRPDEDVLNLCEHEHIVYTPYGPLAMRGGPPQPVESARLAALQELAKRRQIDQAKANLAWLLARSPVMLPIPGTTRIDHLEDDLSAASVHLTHAEMQQIG